jgi:hypothetical protein
MDRERFDGIARAFGRRQGRRAALRAALGLGAALAVGRPVAAMVSRAPGEPCHRDDQCVWDFGQEHVCADNGFDYDGPTNCCTYAYNSCTRNEDCCWDLSCISGTCVYWEPLAGAGKGCWSDRDCDPGTTGLFCDFNDWDNSARVCCGYFGHACQYDGQCCGSSRCRGGSCT